MKIFFLKTTVLFTFLLSASRVYCGKWIPDYSILKDVRDPSLKTNESLILLSFLKDDRKPFEGNIRMAYNSIEKTVISKEKGSFGLSLNPGKCVFRFYYNEKYAEIETDSIFIKPGHRLEIEIRF